MPGKGGRLIQALFSFLLLCLFAAGIGIKGITPSLGLWGDLQWNETVFLKVWQSHLTALLWCVPVFFGLRGWVRTLSAFFWRDINLRLQGPLAFGASLVLFSLYVWGLSVNGLLFAPLVALFFILQAPLGFSPVFPRLKFSAGPWPLFLVFLPWVFEYFSPPIIWDAVLDHFRFARELARTHQMPFQWVNHTGYIPKGAELIGAGFWSLGGEGLAHLSGTLSLAGILWILTGIAKGLGIPGKPMVLLFAACPLFLALFSWGYVEGFLGLYEILAMACFAEALAHKNNRTLFCAGTFFLGAALGVKYTALFALAGAGALVLWEIIRGNKNFKLDGKRAVFFLVPCLPWLLRNYMANGNPFYPMATSWFGGPSGFSPGMEGDLWADTGAPSLLSFAGLLNVFKDNFWTVNNQVGAAWTPLVFMALPWTGRLFKMPWAIRAGIFGLAFWGLWAVFCTSLRHGAGGALVLALLAGLVWGTVLREKSPFPRWLFGCGLLLSFWLCLCAQSTSTAPYGAALGAQDPLVRLCRSYDFNFDTFSAYETIEKNTGGGEKTMAFAVYQTYPLRRAAVVDFFWKKPIFLQWASQCKTADQLAEQLRRQGVTTFLYQRLEAVSMSVKEKDFRLTGMSEAEYRRFWEYDMEPLAVFENSTVYRVRTSPGDKASPLIDLPGIQEMPMASMLRSEADGKMEDAYQTALGMTRAYPALALGWERRAYYAGRLGRWKEAVQSGRKAEGLGFESLDLCDTMAMSLSKAGKRQDAWGWDVKKRNRQAWLDGLKRESLSFESE